MAQQQTIGHSRPRITGLDIARAFALFGIMGNHLLGMGTSASWLASQGMADFHAVSFAMLIGCGIQLEYDVAKQRGASSWKAVVIRSSFLILLGLTMGLWVSRVAVILVTLGLLSLVLRALVVSNTRVLAIFTAITVVSGPLLVSANVAYGWFGTIYNPNFYQLARPTFLPALLFSEPYPLVSWLVYGLVGIFFVRLVLIPGRPHGRIVIATAIGGVVVLIFGWLVADGQNKFTLGLVTGTSYSGSYVNVISSALIVIAGISLCCLISDRLGESGGPVSSSAKNIGTWCIATLSGVGQLTLTWYVVHIAASHAVIRPLENLPAQWAYLDIAVWIGQIAVTILVSPWYLRYRRIGPLEAIPRFLIRGLGALRVNNSPTGGSRG